MRKPKIVNNLYKAHCPTNNHKTRNEWTLNRLKNGGGNTPTRHFENKMTFEAVTPLTANWDFLFYLLNQPPTPQNLANRPVISDSLNQQIPLGIAR